MKNELSKQQSNDILQALDKAIETGPWADSNFLRVIGKNLKEIRDNFANRLTINPELTTTAKEAVLANQARQKSSLQEIFIALYSSEGSNLQSWERILSNLPRQIISRPIYSQEDGVRDLIKSKENKINEAYVAIYISESDILKVHEDKIAFDKLGTPLISLKDRTLDLNNLSRFVHISGTYNYVKGRLVLAN